jgi:hypothetical protein
VSALASEERLLSFEVAGALFTLPIASVVEVSEAAALAAVPGLPRSCGGVMNWHGDALPVIWASLLLEGTPRAADAGAPAHVLVLAEPGGGARLGLPVDRVLGLVDGPAAIARGDGPVAERRPLDGRVANVLDPRRMLARAVEVIQRSIESIERKQGGGG